MSETTLLLPAFSLLFAAVLLGSIALRYWLATRQIRHVAAHRDDVPEAFKGRIDLVAHQRAADYTIARTRLGMIESLVSAALLVALTLLGGLQALMQAALWLFPDSRLLAALAFVAVTFAIGTLVDLPLQAWRRFRLEARFGFNRMTPRLFVIDALKGLLLSAMIGLPMLALILWLMEATGQHWWVYVWLAWVAFSLLALLVFPTLIAPMFNRFEPLPEGELRRRVEALLARCGFRRHAMYVMDGSRRSAHGNAYFTGIGRSRRIVFFDTLISTLQPSEVEAVLAHELGHFSLRHIPKRILLSLALSFAALYLLAWLAGQPWFHQGLGITPAPAMVNASALVLFALVLPVFTFPLQPLFSSLSRRHEFEADAFAARHARAQDLISALVKLYRDNASTLTPDPVHSAFHDSHPPAVQRIGRLATAASPAATPTLMTP